MQDHSVLPALNAVLNATSAALILSGIALIRQERRRAHKYVMTSAVMTSSLFLISYLYYHAHVGTVRFQGQGIPRYVYFAILSSHTILAAAVVPLAAITVVRAFRGRFDRHRISARWTYPVWLYVNITGVVIYFMLYHLYAA